MKIWDIVDIVKAYRLRRFRSLAVVIVCLLTISYPTILHSYHSVLSSDSIQILRHDPSLSLSDPNRYFISALQIPTTFTHTRKKHKPTSTPPSNYDPKSWSYPKPLYDTCKNSLVLDSTEDIFYSDHHEFWESLSPNNITTVKSNWKHFVTTIPPPPSIESGIFKGRGIIYTTYPETLSQTRASIKMLRDLGCELPLEVWHFNKELNNEQQWKLESLGNVKVKDLAIELKKNEASIKKNGGKLIFNYDIGGESRNYEVKVK